MRGGPKSKWHLDGVFSGGGSQGRVWVQLGSSLNLSPPVLGVLQKPLQSRERWGTALGVADHSPSSSSHSGGLREDPIRAIGTELQDRPDTEPEGCELGALGLSGGEGAETRVKGWRPETRAERARGLKMSQNPAPPLAPSITASYQLPSRADAGWCGVSVTCNPGP